jgi:hypothetical protein
MAPSCPTHVVLSEVQTRGEFGGNDEFIMLYNPTSAAIVLTDDWQIIGRSQNDSMDYVKWVGSGGVLPANGFFLIGGAEYSSVPFADDMSMASITDAGRLALMNPTGTIDTLCYAYDTASMTAIKSFPCEGPPATNDHDDTSCSDWDRSMARMPLDCTDTGNNAKDFGPHNPSTPQNSSSTPVVYP